MKPVEAAHTIFSINAICRLYSPLNFAQTFLGTHTAKRKVANHLIYSDNSFAFLMDRSNEVKIIIHTF